MTTAERAYLNRMASAFAKKAEEMKLVKQPMHQAVFETCYELTLQIKQDFEKMEMIEHEQATS